jgi:hypothetical protein
METLRAAVARYRLGWETGESLRALGVELLSDGHDEALPLAIQDARTPKELDYLDWGSLFEQLCEDLGVPIPDMDQAIDFAIAVFLRDIVSKSVTPEAGLRDLVYELETVRSREYLPVDLHGGPQPWIGACYEYEELHNPWASFDGTSREDAIRLLDEEVRQLASEWLAAHPGIPPGQRPHLPGTIGAS